MKTKEHDPTSLTPGIPWTSPRHIGASNVIHLEPILGCILKKMHVYVDQLCMFFP